MIGIVDYGVGNVQALANIYKRLEIPCVLAHRAEELFGASHIILPGVGAFDWAMTRLQASGMREALDDLVQMQGKPVLGICVGMQMMAKSSDEGQLPGLGWFDAHVRKFDERKFVSRTHLPHMGWNDVEPVSTEGLMHGLGTDARFYFLHSYYFHCERSEQVVATCSYGLEFNCAVHHENIYGVQFHPEKSHHFGERLLKNFAEL